jgi:hypothetical protein
MPTDISDCCTPVEIFTLLSRPTWRTDGDTDARIAAIDHLCARPEIRMLAHGVSFRVTAELTTPFRAVGPTLVELSPRAVETPAALRVHVRHALEIVMWHRLRPAPRSSVIEVASAALACSTALAYLDGLPQAERAAALAENAGWFQYLARLFRRGGPDRDVAAGLVGFCSRLLPLQGADPAAICRDLSSEAAAQSLTRDLLPLAVPSEMLLGSGGDSRLKVDPASRLNKYGCSTAPRPVVTFSSCTASSPSDIGYWQAESGRRELIAAALASGSCTDACAAMIQRTREEIVDVLGAASVPGSEVVLAASGTDCELLALHAALEGHTSPVLTIVVGPDEIGSGSLPAASGRHFDEVAPLTLSVAAGAPVEGLPIDRVKVHAVRLREETGKPVEIAALDREVSTEARRAVARGDRVLLHLVDSSKTGMRAPSRRAVETLQRELGSNLTVLIDAAQMRTRTEHLMEAVAAGAMVMVSGSKFFTGAPFSGALVVPPRVAARMREAADVPEGFRAYFSGVEVPPRWRGFRDVLPATPNLGLLMRWRTALAEMQAFRSVPLDVRNEWFAAFRREALSLLERSRYLEPVDAPIGDRTPPGGSDWDEFPTIFAFFLRECDDAGRPTRLLDYEEAWEIYLALNRDISASFQWPSAAERALAATPCHVGQPVRIKGADARFKGALRIAVGARFVSRLAFDPALGPDPASRLEAQLRDLRQAIAKMELIVQYWPALESQTAGNAAAGGRQSSVTAHPSREQACNTPSYASGTRRSPRV